MFDDPTQRTADGGVRLDTVRVPLSVYYALQAPETPPAPGEARILVALHGWGQNSRRFIRDFLPLRSQPLYVICPQGPHQFYLDPGSRRVGFNWLTVYDRQRAIEDVNALIGTILEQVVADHGLQEAPVYVMGFSQGVSMASRYAVRHREHIAGLISVCADLAPDVEALLPTVRPFPVLLCRGEDDPVFTSEKVDAAVAGYGGAGYPVEHFEYPGGHEMTADLVTKLRDWIV
ncbi:MAG: hypothetical protein HYV27_00075 [Candidatus Hydrogenedentes bacterium]|nr:hypothetical protein [Candidatus Hydrogenedentota bacterium]